MKPLHTMTDDEFALAARRAAALPDAPAPWVRAAVAAWTPAPAAAPWRALQGVLRELTAALSFDSWAVTPLAAGVRGLRPDARQLIYSTGGRDIDLRITRLADQRYALAGQVLGPDEAGHALLTPQTGPPAAARSAALDALGEFRIDDLAPGAYLLTLELGEDRINLPVLEIGAGADGEQHAP